MDENTVEAGIEAEEQPTPQDMHHDVSKRSFLFDNKIMSPRRRLRKLEKMKCWPQAKRLIQNGKKVEDIAYFIHVEKKEYTEVTRESLKVIIWKYISDNKHNLFHRAPSGHHALMASLELVDQLDAINLIYALNMDVVMGLYGKVMVNLEAGKNQMPIDALDRIMKTTVAIINTMHEIKKDHRRELKTSTTEVDAMSQVERIKKIYASKYGNRTAGILFNPESRRRLLNALQKVRKSDSADVINILDKNEEKLKNLVGDGHGSGSSQSDS